MMRAHGRWVVAVAASTVLATWAGAAVASVTPPPRTPGSVGWRLVKTWGCGAGEVNSVTAAGPHDGWATGFMTRCSSHRRDLLIARWDGRSWKQVGLPASFADDGTSIGNAVTALSASYSWTFVSSGSKSFALLYQNGRWRTFQLPDGTSLTSAVVFSKSDAWAFGQIAEINSNAPYAVRFNGHAWRRVQLPVVAQASASSAPRNIWAVGNVGPTNINYKLAHWAGQWRTFKFPDLNNTEFDFFSNWVVPDGAQRAWVAVTQWTSYGPFGGVLLKWTGSSWAPAINVPSGQLSLGPIAHDGHGGLWMKTSSIKSCTPAGCSGYEMIHYSAAHGFSKPVSIGAVQVNSMQLIPGSQSLWAGGFSYANGISTHAAMLKFGP